MNPSVIPAPEPTSVLRFAARFAAGPHTAIVGDTVAVLVAVGPEDPLLSTLNALVAEGAAVEELLEAIVARGLRHVPHVAIARIEGAAVRIVARGDAFLADSTDLWDIGGIGVTTWVEQVRPLGAGIEVAIGARSSALPYHVERGVVPAAALRLEAVEHTAPVVPVQPLVDEAEAEAEAETEPGGAALGPEPETSTAIDVSGPADLVAIAGDRMDADEPVDSSDAAGEETVAPIDLVKPSILGSETLVARDLIEHFDALDPSSDMSRVDSGVGASVGDDGELAGGGPGDDGYDHLFGATRALSVEGAAKRAIVEDDDAGVSPSAPAARPTVDAPVVVTPTDLMPSVYHPKVTPPPSAVPGMIDSIPGLGGASRVDAGTGTSSARLAEPLARPSAHDGFTVSIAELRNLRRPTAGTATAGVSPHPEGKTVHAVVCASGHPNPPQARACLQCSAPLSGDEPITVPRPPLGTFVFSSGTNVVVDRPMVVGRSPSVNGQISGEDPKAVTLPSPEQDISRSHLEVRIDGWHVTVVDLRSTNGTTVTLPGQAPQRLHPMEPFLIVPGSVISLGDEASFTFEPR